MDEEETLGLGLHCGYVHPGLRGRTRGTPKKQWGDGASGVGPIQLDTIFKNLDFIFWVAWVTGVLSKDELSWVHRAKNSFDLHLSGL